jgi:hypothetical protein
LKPLAPIARSRPEPHVIAPRATTDRGNFEVNPGTDTRGAIEDFVALLETQGGGRATSGELFGAYELMRCAHGWPKMTQTAFGRSIRVAIEKRGGRKLKSRGQQVYIGVTAPTSIDRDASFS